jgi:hypothetical protein
VTKAINQVRTTRLLSMPTWRIFGAFHTSVRRQVRVSGLTGIWLQRVVELAQRWTVEIRCGPRLAAFGNPATPKHLIKDPPLGM